MPNSFLFNGDPKNYINLIVVNNDSSYIRQSIECWIKTDLKQEQTIIQGIGDGFGQPRWSINQTKHQFYWVEAEKTYESKPGPDLSDGEWHHIAMTYRIDLNFTGTISFYTDGKLIDQQSLAYFGHWAKSLKNVQLQFGAGYGSATSFKGYVSNIRIWNSVLTSDQIEARMRHIITRESGLLASYPILSLDNPVNTVTTTPVDFNTSPGISNVYEPGQCVNPIVELKYYVPQKDFIKFTGQEQQAYEIIQQKLGLKDDIRSFYTDTDLTFTNLLSSLLNFNKPDSIDETSWDNVKKQLGLEFRAVSNIQLTFSHQSIYLSNLQNIIWSTLANAAQLTKIKTSAVVKGNFMNALIESFLSISSYALSAVGKENPEYGALIGASSVLYGLATTTTGNHHTTSDYNFEVAVAGLQKEYIRNYEKLLKTHGDLETTLLTDWGKMEVIQEFIDDQYLFWDPDYSGELTPIISDQMKIHYYQILIPAQWRIYDGYAVVDNPVFGSPGGGSVPANHCINLRKNKPPKWAYKDSLFIADYKHSSFPSKQLINDLTSLKIIDDIWNGKIFGGFTPFVCNTVSLG